MRVAALQLLILTGRTSLSYGHSSWPTPNGQRSVKNGLKEAKTSIASKSHWVGTWALDAHVAAGTNYAAADGSDQSSTILGFSITTSSLPDATRRVAYGPVTLQEAGAGTSTSPYATTFKWAMVTLPKGLKLSSRGVLSGIPRKSLAAGTTQVKVKVTETVTTFKDTKKVRTKMTAQATILLTIICPTL